jgi:hypothetical protein
MAKPAFDPNKPFEAVGQAQKPAFDPSKPFESVEENRLSLEQPSLLMSGIKKLGEGVQYAGEKIDSVTGAPARAAFGAGLDGQNPLSAFINQFAGNTKNAPSGEELALKMGADGERPVYRTAGDQQSHDERYNPNIAELQKKFHGGYQDQKRFSDAEIGGLGLNVGLDPTNIIPVSAAGKGALWAAKQAIAPAKATAKGAAKIGASGIKMLPGGGPIVKGLEVAAEAPKAVKGAIDYVFKPSRADDYGKMVEVAQRNGIDPSLLPESVEFGENSFISRASRNLREGPLGQPELDKFQQGYDSVQSATTNSIKEIAGGKTALSPVDAGATIRQGYDDAVERLFGNVDFTYNEVIRQAPGLGLTKDGAQRVASKLSGMERWANGQLKRGITNTERGQAEQVLRAVSAIRAGNGSLKQTYEAMAQIGRHAFKKGANSLSDIPVDQKKFQDLYFTLRDEFINSTAANLGDDVANALIDSNQQLTMFNANKKYVADLIGKDTLADERLFNSLIMNGDTKKIAALKEILSPEQLQSLKGAALENLIKRDPDGSFNFRTLHSAMRNKRSVLEALLSPEEIVRVGELVKLGERFGNPVLSSSGTGASNLFRDLGKGIGDNTLTRSVIAGMKDSARTPSPLVTSKQASKAAENSMDVRLGFKRPVRTKEEEAAKMLQIISTIGSSQEKDANKRRMEEIARKRLAK